MPQQNVWESPDKLACYDHHSHGVEMAYQSKQIIVMHVLKLVPVNTAIVNDIHESLAQHEFFKSVSQTMRQRYLKRILVTEHIHHT